jgi:N-acetylmuramoyl-L-alanine amidase
MGICITQSNPYIASMYSECRKLSDDILNAYVAETGFSSRGVWETDTMTGNNWATVPTTLLELGFMTNPNEDTLMADSDFQNKMVRGIANGVDKYCFTD